MLAGIKIFSMSQTKLAFQLVHTSIQLHCLKFKLILRQDELGGGEDG